MKKFLPAVILSVAGLLFTANSVGAVQQSKRPTTAKAGTIELIESRDGKFRFTVRDAEGKYVGGSAVGHATEKEAREAVDELKRVLTNASYVSKKSENKDEKGKGK